MKIRIKGRLYEPASPVELSLRDLIALEQATTALGMPVNMGVINDRQAEVDELAKTMPDKKERDSVLGRHPWAQMLFAVNMFAAMRKAGDDITFDAALDLSPTDVTFLMDAEDDEGPDPTGRSPHLKASAAAVKRPADRAKKKPSKKASTRASS